MFTSARADICHEGKKLLPQVPKGILALGNIMFSFFNAYLLDLVIGSWSYLALFLFSLLLL
jgi:hypothetical protein